LQDSLAYAFFTVPLGTPRTLRTK